MDPSIRLFGCGLTNYVNNWDARMDYTVASTRVINGFYSVHNNHREDRLWKVYHCGACTTKKIYKAWSAWSKCTKTCTGSDGVSGTMTRSRTCSNPYSPLPFCSGFSCSSAEKQTVKCNTQRCKVNGGFGAWSAYGACSTTCGAGTKKRIRQCNNPAPAHGGADCVGPTYETAACKVKECPVNGGWGNYSAYGACSTTCGAGKKTRSRQCNNPAPAHGGANCTGAATESADCKVKDCPTGEKVNGKYSDWSELSECSVTCGKGKRTKTRTCTNPAPANGGKPCKGKATKSYTCKMKACTKTCKEENGVCREGKCPEGEKETKKSRKLCKGVTLSGSDKPTRCCTKA